MKTARLAALGVVLLVTVHLFGQHLWLGESPVWFNDIFLIRLKLFDGALSVPFWTIGLALSAIALVGARLLWTRQSRLVALILLAAQSWEAWWRYEQVAGAIDRGHVIGTPMTAGAIMAGVGLVVAVLALTGAFAVHGFGIFGRAQGRLPVKHRVESDVL